MRTILILLVLLPVTCIKSQVIFDGKIIEPEWGVPLGISAGGPSPCFGTGNRLNSLFSSADNENLLFGIGGNIQAGKNMIVFIDSKPGGYSNGGFGRDSSPAGLKYFNHASVFDAGFFPDYCLVISTDNRRSDFFFNLFSLEGTEITGGGKNIFIGSALAANNNSIGANAADNDNTKGFEIAIPREALGFNSTRQEEVKLMAMIITDEGYLDNQFLSNAAANENCYTAAPVNFANRIPDPVIFQPDLLLPITFNYFRIAQRNNRVVLLWASAVENNLLAYEVQHSGDAIGFVTLGFVQAVGNSNMESYYEFTDREPANGKNYYRIKAVDKTGRTAFSPVVKVQYGYVDNSLVIFPNPVKNNLNLQLTGIPKGSYNLVIYNDAGQRMMTRKMEYNGGYGLQQVPLLPNMTKGPYRLVLSNLRGFYKQNFVIQ